MPGLKKITIITSLLLTAIGVLIFIHIISINESAMNNQVKQHNNVRVFLLGASVGKEWNLPALPLRMNTDNFTFESMAVYQFDKTEGLEEILMRPKRKFRPTRTYFSGFFKPAPQRPELIIIKECAAYFPGNMESYKALIKSWVNRINEVPIEVALATVVPITQDRANKQKGAMEAIGEFNDWIVEYSNKENIILLDLESALRTDSHNRYLRDDYSSGDGLHLNKKAYDILDRLLQNTLETKLRINRS